MPWKADTVVHALLRCFETFCHSIGLKTFMETNFRTKTLCTLFITFWLNCFEDIIVLNFWLSSFTSMIFSLTSSFRLRIFFAVECHLMKKYKCSVERSLEILRSKRKCVNPNSGFLAQLRLWEAMRFKLEQDFLRYKMYKLQTVSEHLRRSKIISKLRRGEILDQVLIPIMQTIFTFP